MFLMSTSVTKKTYGLGLGTLLLLLPLLLGAKTVSVSGSSRVSFVSGSANVKAAQLVNPGYRVRTGSTGRVVLAFANGHRLRVGPNSDLVLISYNPQKRHTLIGLTKGRVWNNVKPKSGNRVVVRGRHATAAVMGTIYDIEVSDQETTTRVIEGNVGVRRPEDEASNTIFDHLPALSDIAEQDTNNAPQTAFAPPVEIANPVHEIPSPVTVVPGPYEVSLDEWLQIVENQQISMRSDGKARIETIDPAALQQSEEWFRWNRQMDKQVNQEVRD